MMNKIVEWLDGHRDKVYHFAIGAIIAFIVCTATCFVPIWASVVVSVIVTMGLEFYKEYVMDGTPDWYDILATFLGGLMIWVTVII